MKMNEKRMDTLTNKLGLAHMEVVDCEGKGGIAVLWSRGVNLLLQSKSKYYIDMEVSETGGDGWRFTGVYGEVKTELKFKTWEMLVDLQTQHPPSISWLCRGLR